MKRKFLTLAVMIACATNLVACSKTENESTGSNSTETTTSSQNDSSNSTKSDISEVDPNKENYTKPDYDAWNHDQLETIQKLRCLEKSFKQCMKMVTEHSVLQWKMITIK